MIEVLRNIDLDVRAGERIAIVGASGAGKSTLMHILGGLDQPSEGSIRFEGEEIFRYSSARLDAFRNRSVGFVFQFYNLIPVLTAYENVELPLLLTRLSRRERREHVAAALEIVNLSDRMDHRPSQLSGGQQQRVAIARAIVTDPTILVADEPTGDLDRVSAGEILSLMDQLVQDFHKTIIMVTHDPRAAEKAHVIRHLEKGLLTDG